VLSFGCNAAATVRLGDLKARDDGSTFELQLPAERLRIDLPLPGRHNALNAAAAAAVALAAGIDAPAIKNGLENVRPFAGRLRRLSGLAGSRLFDDSYNANPASVTAAARFLAAQQGPAWLVLGDMRELGDQEAALHATVGEEVRDVGIDRLFAIGELSRNAVAAFGAGATWFATPEDLVQYLQGALSPGINVLVKGSRSMRMERVVDALRAANGSRES